MNEEFKLELSIRPRRLRSSVSRRALVAETRLAPSDLISPLFVVDGDGDPEPVEAMPGVVRFPVRRLVTECRELFELGIPAVALFPCLEASQKDATGSGALDGNTLVLRAVRAIKRDVPGLTVITDIALDPYTTHGHDGLLNGDGTDVDNDATVAVLTRMAVLHAETGVDWVAPSDMMDGRVGTIRAALDTAGATDTGILAYSAKFASAFYGPFREAVGSATGRDRPVLDKRTYQLEPGNRREALREVWLDESEGADVVMVKPAGPYLDIIRDVREQSGLPVAAYQVSGEYAQIHAAAERGWLDLRACRDESLLAIKRAGADMILTYFARAVAERR